MCGKSFKKVDYMDCKIIAFNVKKRVLFILYKTWSSNFASSWLKTFVLHKVEASDVVLGN
jgi:hypothetical protein